MKNLIIAFILSKVLFTALPILAQVEEVKIRYAQYRQNSSLLLKA